MFPANGIPPARFPEFRVISPFKRRKLTFFGPRDLPEPIHLDPFRQFRFGSR